MDERRAIILELGWQLVARLLAGLSTLPGLGQGHAAYSVLRRAEATARRLLVIMAGELTVPPTANPQQDPGEATRLAKVTPEERKPRGFALFDPLRPFHIPSDMSPATVAASRAWKPDLSGQRPATHFTERLGALAGLLDDPSPAVLRMARWLTRPATASKPGRRISPLRPGRPPGYRIAHALNPAEDVLMQAHLAALAVLDRSHAPP